MPILTAHLGTNSQVLPYILDLYVKPGSVVADVTYGKGVFWQQVDVTQYKLLPSDIAELSYDELRAIEDKAPNILQGIDFRHLPYKSECLDALILDPPYMHDSSTVKNSINKCYKNANGSHASVIRLYAGGILEAARVLKKKGIIVVKCQDEIESAKQRFSHCQIMGMLKDFGFEIEDLFVLMPGTIPARSKDYQHHARKNHSYFVVARFKR